MDALLSIYTKLHHQFLFNLIKFNSPALKPQAFIDTPFLNPLASSILGSGILHLYKVTLHHKGNS